VVKKNRKKTPEALVQWENMSPDEATWESTEHLAYQFPHLHLEDKMLPKGQGMLGSRVSTLEIQDTPGSDNSPGVGATGNNLRRPDSKKKHAVPVEAPSYQPMD